jgi:16S rRNA (cytosine1402-N4)-methyltransferase
LLTKKPLTASKQELADNPRSRSAKLRAAEKEKAA